MRQANKMNAAGQAARLILYAGVRSGSPAVRAQDRLRRHWHSRSAEGESAASGGRS